TAQQRGEPPASVVLRPEMATKFGPYKDAKDHEFHKVSFSDFVTGSDLCASCHDSPAKSGTLAVFTSTAEWRAGTHKTETCQSCHMPTLTAKVYKGAEKTRTVYRHDFSADRGASLALALALDVHLAGKGPDRIAEIALRNKTAGHAIPTDLPERRLR